MKVLGMQLVEMTTALPDNQGKSAIQVIAEADLPVKVSLRIARLMKDLVAEAAILDQERVKLIRKFGTKDDATGNISVPPDRFLEFRVEWQKALDSEVEIDREAINLSDKDIEGLRIAPRIILCLEPAVTFGEPDGTPIPKPGA